MPIAPSVLNKAVRNNPIYARRLDWKDRYQQISQKIGFSNMSPGPEAFAEGVFRWQGSHPPLKADGILGPKTWEKLEPQTRFTAAGPVPDWLRTAPPTPAVPSAADEAPEISTNVWFGFSVDFGGHAVVYGRNTMYAWMYSMDSFGRQFRIESERNRFGPGLGGGAGVSFIMINGLARPGQLQGERQTAWDFQLSLGGRWGDLLKSANKYRSIRHALRRADQGSDASSRGIRAMREFLRNNHETLTRLSEGDWNDIRKRLVEAGDAVDMARNQSEPRIVSMGIPIPGIQLEISGYYQSGRMRIFGVREPAGG